MSTWDKVLPHRLLINHSLNKEAEKLRSCIDDYQIEYNRKIECCAAEIEQVKADKNQEFENVKKLFSDKLESDKEFFDNIQCYLSEYIDFHFQLQVKKGILAIKKLEKENHIEYRKFLSQQIEIAKEDINVLKERKDILVLKANVDDVIKLISLSGAELIVDDNDNALTMLDKVSNLIDEHKGDKIRRKSLMQLSIMLQERVEFLSAIKYISWVIGQKNKFRNQLFSEKENVTKNLNEKIKEIKQLINDIKLINDSKRELYGVIKEQWEIPIAQLRIEISDKNNELNQFFDEKKSRRSDLSEVYGEIKRINGQLQEMMEVKSNDNATWTELQSKKKREKDKIPLIKKEIEMVNAQISQIKNDIDSLKNERQQWFERMQVIYELCTKSHMQLIPSHMSQDLEKCEKIDKKIDRLYRNEEFNIAEQHFKEKSENIRKEQREKESEIKSKIQKAEENLREKKDAFKRAKDRIKISKKNDKRSFFKKIFSESKEVKVAKEILKETDKQKKEAESNVRNLNNILKNTMNDFDRKIEYMRPKPYIPNSEEEKEIQKLKNKKAQIMNNLAQSKIKKQEKE